MSTKRAVSYYFNLNTRAKAFDGWQPDHPVVYVGATTVFVGDYTPPQMVAEEAFRAFNRIDADVPVLDDNEAPSMSVGDIVTVGMPGEVAHTYIVERLGFRRLSEDECMSIRAIPRAEGESVMDIHDRYTAAQERARVAAEAEAKAEAARQARQADRDGVIGGAS